jgi:hypothetical protein
VDLAVAQFIPVLVVQVILLLSSHLKEVMVEMELGLLEPA